MKIGIILGYGIFDIKNKKYKKYLDSSYRIIKKQKIDKIIFCGGFTNPNKNISEAKSMSEYILKKDFSLEKNIILEEKSFTTFENILFANEITKNIDNKFELNIICDSIRAPKVSIYVNQIFFGFSKEKCLKLLSEYLVKIDINNNFFIHFSDVNYFGIKMTRTKNELAEQITGSIIQADYFELRNLHETFLIKRRRKWGFKY